jgi:hypothetical protein
VQSWLEDSPWRPATNSGGDGIVNLEDAEDNLEALKRLLLVLLVGGWWRRRGGDPEASRSWCRIGEQRPDL